jgi:pimeloyl-ACP methyl ester carboxylesterase
MTSSLARRPEILCWVQRMSASLATAVAMIRLWYEVDVRSVLPAIRVPTLVIARAANALVPACHSRYLADHIAAAKYIEFPGADLLFFTGHADQVLDASLDDECFPIPAGGGGGGRLASGGSAVG